MIPSAFGISEQSAPGDVDFSAEILQLMNGLRQIPSRAYACPRYKAGAVEVASGLVEHARTEP
jgi:hypothetical protein